MITTNFFGNKISVMSNSTIIGQSMRNCHSYTNTITSIVIAQLSEVVTAIAISNALAIPLSNAHPGNGFKRGSPIDPVIAPKNGMLQGPEIFSPKPEMCQGRAISGFLKNGHVRGHNLQ